MGVSSYLPYARGKNHAVVAIWSGAHGIVGHVKGSNVVCELQRPNGLWYKRASGPDYHPHDSNYSPVADAATSISAALVDLYPLPDGYGWGACPNNTDQPGPRFLDRAVLVPTVIAVLAGLVATGVIIKRRRIQHATHTIQLE